MTVAKIARWVRHDGPSNVCISGVTSATTAETTCYEAFESSSDIPAAVIDRDIELVKRDVVKFQNVRFPILLVLSLPPHPVLRADGLSLR